MISRGTWQKLFVLTGVVGPAISALLWLWMAEEHYRNKSEMIISGGPFPSHRCHAHLEGQARVCFPNAFSWSGTWKPVSRVGMQCLVLSCSSKAADAAEASWQLGCLWDQKVQHLLGLLHLLVHLAREALVQSNAFHLPSWAEEYINCSYVLSSVHLGNN